MNVAVRSFLRWADGDHTHLLSWQVTECKHAICITEKKKRWNALLLWHPPVVSEIAVEKVVSSCGPRHIPIRTARNDAAKRGLDHLRMWSGSQLLEQCVLGALHLEPSTSLRLAEDVQFAVQLVIQNVFITRPNGTKLITTHTQRPKDPKRCGPVVTGF